MNETLTVSLFSSAGAQPISLKSFRGLGHFPNKIARVYKHEHCAKVRFAVGGGNEVGTAVHCLPEWQKLRCGTHRICLWAIFPWMSR